MQFCQQSNSSPPKTAYSFPRLFRAETHSTRYISKALSLLPAGMAEVLGLVASGISVAQVAGSIVTTSLKVKGLLDEIKDAPETLENMLDQIDLLTPILCEATADSHEVAGTSPLPLPATSHLQQALQKTLAACQTAGEQLQLLATDLMSQINVAHGGVRRMRAIVKVVLKKSTLARYEARLQKIIQLLTLAQNTYIM